MELIKLHQYARVLFYFTLNSLNFIRKWKEILVSSRDCVCLPVFLRLLHIKYFIGILITNILLDIQRSVLFAHIKKILY